MRNARRVKDARRFALPRPSLKHIGRWRERSTVRVTWRRRSSKCGVELSWIRVARNYTTSLEPCWCVNRRVHRILLRRTKRLKVPEPPTHLEPLQAERPCRLSRKRKGNMPKRYG